MKKKTRLWLGISALAGGILTSTAFEFYFIGKNISSYDNAIEIIETQRMLSSPNELENICSASKQLSESLKKQGDLRNFYTGDYGTQKAFEDYVKKHCRE